MKLTILTRNPRGYSVRRFREAAKARGHLLSVRDTLKYSVYVEPDRPDLSYKHKPVTRVDAVIPRIGPSITPYGTSVLRQFEQMGVFCLNSAVAVSVSRDKLRSMQILSRHDIGIPASAFVRDKHDILPAIDRVGGAPVVIKLLEGSQGVGVILAETAKIAEAIIETLHSARQNVLVQKFVAESKGKDIRAFVVGGRVVAAMRRVAAGQEFRSNIHRGGSTQRVELSPEYEQTAVKAAQIVGLRMAGVDMLEGKDGPQVMEVNSSPGLEGIEKATGVDIASAVIEHIEEQVLFPDIDLRQRLGLSAGYGVCEFVIDRKSELAKQTIADSGLREREVLVLNVDRNGVNFPAPDGAHELLAGDKLLCFGKLITLKALIPTKKRRRPRKRPTS
ncbi:MAG: RimK family alpha-L-glutamate ligase [Planctomycetota bacterium]